MACETPVVATKVGGIPYAIKENLGGFLVEQKNPRQLANAILTLLNDEELRRNQGKIGRKYVIENFSQQKITWMYVKIFRELINFLRS
jgi:glycosyltransferase involved in cell wall biosynthesis